jgi:hypothetical protein
MTNVDIVAQKVFAFDSSEFRLACLNRCFKLDEKLKAFVRGTCLNFRPTFHGYYIRIPSVNLKLIVFVQAYVEAVFTLESGFIFRHPDCYLARAYDLNILNNEAISLYENLDSAVDAEGQIPTAVFSGSQKHLAHYLWNHLASLWRFFTDLSRLSLDSIDVYIAPYSELYGPLAKIYQCFGFANFISSHPPELLPKDCNRKIIPAIIVEPYENKFIPQELINSILSLALLESPRCRERQYSFVYSPRTHSRRPSNRSDIFISFLRFISSIDKGLNSRLFLDLSSRMWCNDLLINEAEVQLADELVVLAGRLFPSIQVVPLVSSPILETISLLSMTSFGVYEWGANLSWYSWLLRKPVIALAPPKVSQRLDSSQKTLETWGSFFWESDSPSPMLPSTTLAAGINIDPTQSINRFAPDDYIVNVSQLGHMLLQTYERVQRCL